MKRCAFTAALVVVLLATQCLGQKADPVADSKTFGMSNGRFWKLLPANGKIVYMVGVVDATQWKVQEKGPTDEEYRKATLSEWADGFTNGDYIQVLDEFYKQPENVLIPIVMAVKYYCTPKLTGTWKAADLEKVLIEIRTVANSNHATFPAPPAAPAIPPGYEIEKPAAPAKP